MAERIIIREWGSDDERERIWCIAPEGHIASVDPKQLDLCLGSGYQLATLDDLRAASKANREAGRMEDTKLEHTLKMFPAG